MTFVTINKERIKFLLSLYKITIDEFLGIISKGKKNPLSWDDVYRDDIDINILKRVDLAFHKGLFYYADPTTPANGKNVSVFFRKNSFGTDLNLGTRQRVREFEDLKTHLNAISILSNVKLVRKYKAYTINDDPRSTAFDLREKSLPEFTYLKRDFLRNFINKLGDQNIFVFEFVDVPNKKEKANADGFYLSPNAIVLKRRQESFSREIFTLAHEFGHYLLNQEEIEEVDITKMYSKDHILSDVENWCNIFAFYLLLGKENAKILDSIVSCDDSNDYCHSLVAEISKETNLSRLAIFTNLLLLKKLSYDSYVNIKDDLDEQWRSRMEQQALIKEQNKANGIVTRGSNPKPIFAEIVKDVFGIALSSGVIGEQEYCKAMKIKPDKINELRYSL